MRFFKTELTIGRTDEELDLATWEATRNQFRTNLDITENVALAYNYQGIIGFTKRLAIAVAYDFEAEQLEDVKQLEEQSNTIRRLFRDMVPVF